MTRKAGISVIPTLVAFHNIVRQATDVKSYLRNPDLVYLPPFIRAELEPARNTYANRFSRETVPGLAVSYEFQRQLVRALHEGGVPILAGTDVAWLGVPGFSLIEEIENFQELGFTPYAALKTATVDPARLLRREEEFGTIEVGKRADLLLTRENPLEDVRNLRSLDGVMAGGRWIPGPERRRLLESLPASYRDELSRLVRLAESDPAALGRELDANDPFGSISAEVWTRVASAGPDKVVESLRRLRAADPKSPLLSEETLNELGYNLVGVDQSAAAVEVFRLNTELYPKSGNTYDSLAEAYLRAGNRELALRNYAKALEVQPDYPNAKAAREILREKTEPTPAAP
jgi:tetratricopeptide (TPR) repeat protein